MTSFKSRMFNFFMRKGHLLRGQLRKQRFDLNTSIEDFRDRCEKGAKRYARIPEGIAIKEETIAGIKSEWLIPDGADAQRSHRSHG